jgi:hypothetical protein
MKKTLLSSALALATIISTNSNASISITNMEFNGTSYTATGEINDDGTMGTLESVEDFFTVPWTATQETAVITNSNGITWESAGSWDYSADIANMTDDQVAVGVLWNWNNNNGAAVLAVFDCTSNTACIGQTIGADGNEFGGIQNGAIVGPLVSFSGNGTLSTVPIPSAIWLLSSGLLGLVSVARRNKTIE